MWTRSERGDGSCGCSPPRPFEAREGEKAAKRSLREGRDAQRLALDELASLPASRKAAPPRARLGEAGRVEPARPPRHCGLDRSEWTGPAAARRIDSSGREKARRRPTKAERSKDRRKSRHEQVAGRKRTPISRPEREWRVDSLLEAVSEKEREGGGKFRASVSGLGQLDQVEMGYLRQRG